MSDVATREMTLREKAREWLKNYKAGDAYGGNVLSLEEMAAIVAEYLHESKDGDSYREKYDKCRAELEKELERNANLEQFVLKLVEVQHVTASTLDQYEKELTSERIKALRAAKVELLHGDLEEAQNEAEVLRKKNEELRSHIHMLEREMDRMGGQIAAYEFVIRCNGMSGAEVHT